jgi:hypothetical protein
MFRKIILFISLFLVPLSVNANEEIIKLSTREGITLDLLVSTPKASNGTALIMFPGDDGSKHFSMKNGVIKRGTNSLVRTVPDFTNKGFLVEVVGLPSDKPYGMDDNFRTSDNHLQDITKVVQYILGKGYKSVFLVGTSRGTISTAYLGATLKNSAVKGIVLTSTMKYAFYLRWIPLGKTSYPVLILHHKDDNCKNSPYSDASKLAKRYKNSPQVDFESVSGGLPPQSDPCEPLSAHGYFGIEEKVVDMIASWVLKVAPLKRHSQIYPLRFAFGSA